MQIDKDDFEAWKDNPITQAFMRCCGIWADQAKGLWVSASWDGGVNKDTDLWRMKGQAEALLDIQSITAEKIEGTLDESQA